MLQKRSGKDVEWHSKKDEAVQRAVRRLGRLHEYIGFTQHEAPQSSCRSHGHENGNRAHKAEQEDPKNKEDCGQHDLCHLLDLTVVAVFGAEMEDHDHFAQAGNAQHDATDQNDPIE